MSTLECFWVWLAWIRKWISRWISRSDIQYFMLKAMLEDQLPWLGLVRSMQEMHTLHLKQIWANTANTCILTRLVQPLPWSYIYRLTVQEVHVSDYLPAVSYGESLTWNGYLLCLALPPPCQYPTWVQTTPQVRLRRQAYDRLIKLNVYI